MPDVFLSPERLRIANELMQWAESYLTQENDNIKRPHGTQVVCPFVEPSISNGSFYMVFHSDITGENTQEIERLMVEKHMKSFKDMKPYSAREKFTKALLVVFPSIPEKDLEVLDIVHRNIKAEFVRNGLMVGQFHKKCNERGVYNGKFKVSVSPYPLIAVRHMAVHDILFLGGDSGNKEWFLQYNLLYGHKFEKDKNGNVNIEEYNSHLIPHYLNAKQRWVRP